MKAYTDMEQSKELSEILLPESADMCYYYKDNKPQLTPYSEHNNRYYIPCWSLSTLLGFLDRTAYFIDEDASVSLSSYKTIKWTVGIDNSDLELITEADPVDACVKMILKLHELNLL